MTRIPAGGTVKYSSEPEIEADMIFGFLDDTEEWSSGSSCNSGESYGGGTTAGNLLEEEEEEEDESSCNVEENKAFWESQDKLLLANLRRSSSIEAKIRQATKEALRESNLVGKNCVCQRPGPETCRNCMRREISDRLRHAGFNCGICKSKWKSSKDTLSGEHTYLEVVDNSNSNSKKGEMRVVIELNFRGEFEMARASEEYNQLINKLPEVYVGKIERLQALIKLLCSASKKCAKDRKIHMAPWRKQKYMQAKWIGTREQKSSASTLQVERLEQPQRQRTSMLTFDLLNNISGFKNAAIRVV
ncbi:hypothetical protein LguiA_035161 [Lonicera macranthoides]